MDFCFCVDHVHSVPLCIRVSFDLKQFFSRLSKIECAGKQYGVDISSTIHGGKENVRHFVRIHSARQNNEDSSCPRIST